MEWPERIDTKIAALLVDTQWIAYLDRLSQGTVQRWQTRRLGQLLAGAIEQSPWWRERLSHLDGRIRLADVPILSRAEYRDSIETVGGALSIPPEHGRAYSSSTSGSSGVPVQFYSSALAARIMAAEWYHDDIRQGRDRTMLRAELAGRVPQHSGEHIVVPGNPLLRTADGVQRRVPSFTVEEHAKWLTRVKPRYLSTAPELLAGMLDVYESGAVAPPSVEQVMTYAETVDGDLRRRARSLLGAAIRDRYSSEEVGPIAFQCPASEQHHHLASSNVVVEVLDENDRPCRPGVVGRVIVTGLHNWASPVIRYELNDLAAWAPACPCGRQAPVLAALLGRKRFLLRLPSGERKAPRIAARHWLALAPVREHRLVQISQTTLHAELVVERPLTEDERCAILSMLRQQISPELVYEIHEVERIEWSATYKRQDVLSLI